MKISRIEKRQCTGIRGERGYWWLDSGGGRSDPKAVVIKAKVKKCLVYRKKGDGVGLPHLPIDRLEKGHRR